ncbi:MAG: ATP-binding protein, partial [Armatimonadota bacterium]
GDDFGTAITLGQLGRLHAHLGNYEHALTFLSRDLELSRQFGDLNATMVLLNNIGDLHLARGDAQKALESYQRSLALAEKTRFERGIGFAKCCLTKAYVALGQIQEACAAADEAEAILDDVGERLGLGTLLTQRAQIESARQNYGLAEQYHERAISTFRELDMPAPLANALFECGLMFRDLGDIEKAAPRLREAIAVAERLQFQKLAQRYREAVETVEGRQWIEVVAELREARERLAEEHRRLQRKDAQLEWLTEMAVHDLKSPLQAITAALHGALEHPDDSRFSQEMVNLALDSARVLCEMVDDMLTVLGSESAALRPRLEPIQLREVVAAVTDQLRPSASQADVRLVQDVPESLPTINADPRLIRRVIVNLVGNAIKHTRDGEVRVTATEEPDAVVVTVADTGSGIPPDVQDRVFDMWFHAEEFARDRRVRGTGLGLPFCRAAVEAHGGRIWVKSELGRGSTFAFRLPLKSLAH